jgi:hypothetical protein
LADVHVSYSRRDCSKNIRLRSAEQNELRSVIEAGSLVHTDAWVAFDPLPRRGYRHQVTWLGQTGERARVPWTEC